MSSRPCPSAPSPRPARWHAPCNQSRMKTYNVRVSEAGKSNDVNLTVEAADLKELVSKLRALHLKLERVASSTTS